MHCLSAHHRVSMWDRGQHELMLGFEFCSVTMADAQEDKGPHDSTFHTLLPLYQSKFWSQAQFQCTGEIHSVQDRWDGENICWTLIQTVWLLNCYRIRFCLWWKLQSSNHHRILWQVHEIKCVNCSVSSAWTW